MLVICQPNAEASTGRSVAGEVYNGDKLSISAIKPCLFQESICHKQCLKQELKLSCCIIPALQLSTCHGITVFEGFDT